MKETSVSGFKKFIAMFIVFIVFWTIWSYVRGGDSLDVKNAKIACAIEKNEDDVWILGNLFEVFPDFNINEVQGKSGDVYPDVLAYLAKQSAAAAGAAQLNGRWSSLADATSEYLASIQLLYIIAVENGGSSDIGAEAGRLSVVSSIRKSSECQAFLNRLNS
jgi:hypothetical protein